MDGLPPIKDLSLTQRRIREALKNAPPLKITKKPNNENFIVFDNKNVKNENSLFDRFLKHKTMSSINCSDNQNSKNTIHKWTELKDKMTEELEIKRMESQKFKDINEKIQNEEIDEDIDHKLDEQLNDDIEDNEKNDDKTEDKSESEQSEDSSEEEEEEDNEDNGGEEEEEDDGEEEEEDDEEEQMTHSRHSNPFIDGEAEDDEDVNESIDERFETNSNESRDSFGLNAFLSPQKKLPFIDSNENNDLNTTFTSLDESFERKCATQKIAFSPFISQKPKPRFPSNQDFSELVSNFGSNAEEFNSQSILDLCSGNFSQNIEKVLSETQNEIEDSQRYDPIDKLIDQNLDFGDDEDEEDLGMDEVLNRSKRVTKTFNIEESDCESENEDKDNGKISEEVITSLRSFNGSDGEELIVTEDEDDGEEGAQEGEQTNVNAFFDDEAELSGSDEVSSDEDEADDDVPEDEEQDLEDLPSDSEMENQNQKYFNKQILDEEKRNIMLWKERLFEDGDLHEDGRQRQKKFRWNFETDDTFVNDYINEDSDDNYMESDEDEKTTTPALKMYDQNSGLENKSIENSEKPKLKPTLSLKNINKTIVSDKSGVNSLSAFVVRDERLKSVISFESKRSLDSKSSFKSNKKFKTSKKCAKTSIFDLLNV